MLTTTERNFVADVSKLPSTPPSSPGYSWPETVRPSGAGQFTDAPVKGASEIFLSDAAVTSSAGTGAVDVSSRFGLRLRELRRGRNLTQLRMAREFGIDRSFISDVERGRKSISLPMLEVIALGMKVSLSELLSGL